MKSRFLCASVAAALIAMAIGCGGPTNATPSGNFRVMLKDTPFGDAKAVLVTFSDVSVHASGGAWTTVLTTPRTCDLKQLQNAQDVLGATTLTAGHYTQVRLTVSSAALYWQNAAPAGACAASITVGGDYSTIEVPPGQLILNRPFDVGSAGTITMLIDFDGDKSINQTGNGAYMMQPVISVVSVQ